MGPDDEIEHLDTGRPAGHAAVERALGRFRATPAVQETITNLVEAGPRWACACLR